MLERTDQSNWDSVFLLKNHVFLKNAFFFFSKRNHQGSLLDSGLNFFWKLVTVGERELWNSALSGSYPKKFLFCWSVSYSLAFPSLFFFNHYNKSVYFVSQIFSLLWTSQKIEEDCVRNIFLNTILLEDDFKLILSADRWQDSFAGNNRTRFWWYSKDMKNIPRALRLYMNGALEVSVAGVSVHFLMAG